MCYTIALKMSLYPPQKTFLEELEKNFTRMYFILQ